MTLRATHGTFRWSGPQGGTFIITVFGSDADTARKGWRSIGCTSVRADELVASVKALERNGYKRERRSIVEMARVERVNNNRPGEAA